MLLLYQLKKKLGRLLPSAAHDIFLRYRWPLYLGRRYACPFCHTRFRRMVPGGAVAPVLQTQQITGMFYHENMTCPRCHSIDRWRLLYLFLQERTNIFRDKLRVLHVSPERELQLALRTAENLDYLSADLANPLAMVRMDITDIDQPDASFDVVLCSHVLEHIPDDRKAMSEIFRVLRPGGWAILQVPVSLTRETTFEDPSVTQPEERTRVFGQYDHVRIYGADYVGRLREAGFTVRVYDAIEAVGEDAVRRHALDGSERVFYCTKPVAADRQAPTASTGK